MLKRRFFLAAVAGAGGTLLLPKLIAADADNDAVKAMQTHWRALLPPGAEVPEASAEINKSAAEWQAELERDAYRVLFEDATEPPFSSPLNNEHRRGVFVCAACALPLFTSEMKYDSGTGWPSFLTSIPGHLDTKTDFKLIWPRTEYHCIRCHGHQGHVFGDGPAPTGKRWCNNGVALRFIAAA